MRYLIVFIPVLMTIALALRDQYERKNLTGSVLLTVTSLLVMVRFCILAHFFDTDQRMPLLGVAEQLSSMYIMPFTYMYLCDQCGTRWNNREAIFMLCLPAMLLGSLVQGFDQFDWRDGIVITQCVIIGLCMVRLWKRIRLYGMAFSRQLKVYFFWMALLLLFTIFSFAIGMDRSMGEGSHWSFFIYYTIVISSGYLLIPYSFRVKPADSSVKQETEAVAVAEPMAAPAAPVCDSEPVSTTEPAPPQYADEHAGEEDDESVGIFSEQLVSAMHHMMEEEQYYLQHNTNIDDVAQRLGTNRTYVTRLMRQEFGLSFIEYVNVARIQYSMKLLYNSPQASLDDIAMHSGFQSTSNYCRAFKRYTGTTPKTWLQQLQDAK